MSPVKQCEHELGFPIALYLFHIVLILYHAVGYVYTLTKIRHRPQTLKNKKTGYICKATSSIFPPSEHVITILFQPMCLPILSAFVVLLSSNKQKTPAFAKASAACCHFQTFPSLSHHHDLVLFCSLIAELDLWDCAVVAGNGAPENS